MVRWKRALGILLQSILRPKHVVVQMQCNGYCYDLQIYTVEKVLASRVVKNLMENYQVLGRHLYVHNYYTSPQLFKDLLEAGTLACGAIRGNRKDFPAAVKDNVDQNDSLFCKVDMTEGFMTVVYWKDKRDVFALTTIHGDAVGDDIPHKPELIYEYNEYMGGVDHNEQLLVYFGRKTLKWRKSVFWRLLELVNSHRLYKLS